MKLKALATLGIASLVLSFSIAPAKADDVPVPVSAVVETVSASPDVTLTFESPQVETIPAPVPEAIPVTVPEEVQPIVEPVPVVTQPLAPVVSAPVAPVEVTPPAVPAETVRPVPAAPTVTAPAVVQPVIVENPLCLGQNLFTVTAEGVCAPAPLGYTVADLRKDALSELNSRSPVVPQEVSDVFEKTYLGATSQPLPHQHIVRSATITGVYYNFDSNY